MLCILYHVILHCIVLLCYSNVSVLRSGSQRVLLKHNPSFRGWNSHAHGEFPGMSESTNLSRDNDYVVVIYPCYAYYISRMLYLITVIFILLSICYYLYTAYILAVCYVCILTVIVTYPCFPQGKAANTFSCKGYHSGIRN